MIVDIALIASTVALTHVTYLATYQSVEPSQRPHNRLIRATRTGVVVVVGRVWHHGRWIYWQLAILLPAVRVTRASEEASEE